MNRLRPLRLQPPLNALHRREVAQALQVARAQRLEMAQHQRGDGITHRDFDLRQAVALIHAGHEIAQRHQHRAQMRWQHLTAVHVGHVARFALVKTHQHAALLDHVTHRQASSVAVTPGRTLDRAQHALGFHLAQMPQRVLKCALLGRDLRTHVKVLHLAATTGAEMAAAWRHALRTLATQSHQRGLLPIVLFALNTDLHFFARQRALDEHHLAFGVVRHALRFEVE